MYLIIFEGSEVFYREQINDKFLEDANLGLVDVIDISNPCNPLTYYNGWHSLDEVDSNLYPEKMTREQLMEWDIPHPFYNTEEGVGV